MAAEHEPQHPGTPNSGSKWVLIGFGAIAVFFLLAEHRAHLWSWLPWLLLLACPLMHLFHGHGGHGGHEGHGAGKPSDEPGSPPGPAQGHEHHHGDESGPNRS